MSAGVPARMRAIEIVRPGPPGVLTPVERPTPRPAAGESLIEVAAAGVNRPDVMQRLGKYPPPSGASDIPGLEVAGTIVEIGDGVTGWQLGDEVCALVNGGGYAEYCVAPARQCLRVPAGLRTVNVVTGQSGAAEPRDPAACLIAAAGIPETFFTVWTNVFERGRLRAGETLLVHGGASGIGTTAIQLARAFGARVLATAGTPEKCGACEVLGAERAINYRTEDFVEIVRAATGGRGVDLVLDMVGGDYIPRNLEILAVDGRLVQIALQRGVEAAVNFVPVMQRRLTLTGSTLRPRSVAEKGAIARAIEEHVWPLVEAGRVGPVIHATFPLARAAAAHEMMEADTHIGKLILTCR